MITFAEAVVQVCEVQVNLIIAVTGEAVFKVCGGEGNKFWYWSSRFLNIAPLYLCFIACHNIFLKTDSS